MATTSGDVALHALANVFLGMTYQAQGDYRRAIDCCGKSMASLTEAQRHERFGEVFPPAVISRAWLTACHAELGTSVKGRAVGEEGIQSVHWGSPVRTRNVGTRRMPCGSSVRSPPMMILRKLHRLQHTSDRPSR